MQTDIINRGEQNVTLTFKVKGLGQSANVQKQNIWQSIGHRKLILTCAYCIINQGNSNVNLIFEVTDQGHSENVAEQSVTPCSIKCIVHN